MRVIEPGHVYELRVLDEPEAVLELTFVKREGAMYPGNVGHHPGTNIQEVLRAAVDRLEYVNAQIPDEDTYAAWQFCRGAIYALELRAARRHGRAATFSMDDAVRGPTCAKCGHVGCGGECHP